MPTQYNDDAWRRSLEYTYYPAAGGSQQQQPASFNAQHHHSQHHAQPAFAPLYAPAYSASSQYYAAPLAVAPYAASSGDSSDTYLLQTNTASASTSSSTATPTTTSYTDMLAMSIGDADFDDVRMLQEMLLTPHPVDAELTREAHATLLFQSPFSRPQVAPVVSMPALSTSTPTTTKMSAARPLTPLSSSEGHTTPSSFSGPRYARNRSRAQSKIPSTRICRVPDCNKGIRSRGLCKAHGGGRRCQTPGCTISDQGGGHCIAHGGGKRCTVGGCDKSAQFKGLCKVHGGSRRCRVEDCDKNGQIKGLCRQHYTQSVQDHGHGDSEF